MKTLGKTVLATAGAALLALAPATPAWAAPSEGAAGSENHVAEQQVSPMKCGDFLGTNIRVRRAPFLDSAVNGYASQGQYCVLYGDEATGDWASCGDYSSNQWRFVEMSNDPLRGWVLDCWLSH
ncbi:MULTISPECIES: hypothetical protein [Actinopolyspora]|uniref:SH3 domain-containing protein n=1 Tax=Actinopolyspora saharensis TaxID=995062 RepID=A0A1H0YSE0_9ACTN|nr:MULTISPECIES: hypothetical protein [Actinopolyspora]NHD19443.1 hypothetical protein [Actinopolyspora sp. BKK2]NHE78484.1 hypothetical protein [Actinopolyspora sp. BKK1]SDQ18073.1 hypothetical protein SAMN04489718_0645 [Actinopolyspora saharensis]